MSFFATAPPLGGTIVGLSVCIVESPNSGDLYLGRHEGAALRDALRLVGLPAECRLVVNRSALREALTSGLVEMMRTYPNRIPAIHLSAHGDRNGIQLTSGETISWSELGDLLRPFNAYIAHGLILCVSACDGFAYAFEKIAKGGAPYEHLVSCAGKPTWAETLIGFLTFYLRWTRGGIGIREVVDAMKVASGFDGFEHRDSLNAIGPSP